jgi:hypothetical protein
MKKLRLVFIALALIAGVGGAFATIPDPNCIWEIQFHKVNGAYTQIWGEFGAQWYCAQNEAETCSYYWDAVSHSYLPCRIGEFNWIFGR